VNLQKAFDPATAARDILDRLNDGDLDEREARLKLAGVIEASNVPVAVAREVQGITDRHRRDLASLLSEMMLGRVTGTGGFCQSLDLERIREGADINAWARQLLRSAVPSKMRDIRLVDSHEALVDPTNAASAETTSFSGMAYAQASVSGADIAIEDDHFTEQFNSMAPESRTLRRTGQTKRNARTLREAYAITAPLVIPEAPADRSWLISYLGAETDAAGETRFTHIMETYASLNVWVAVVSGRGNPRADIDDRLLGLWDDFTLEQAEDLLELRPAVAHTIALAEAMLAPKPSRDVVARAISATKMAAAGHDWDLHAKALISAWVANESAAVSEFNTKTVVDFEAAEAERVALAETLPAQLEQTAAWHNQPLGAKQDDVDAFLRRLFTSLDPENFPA
jgi:hypothetical protein